VPAGYAQTPEVRTFEAYPYLLHRSLAYRFSHAVINVVVTAIGGENAEGGAKRFQADVLALHPDLVTIDYSLNDRGIGLDRSRKAWIEMIQEAAAAKVRLILLTPTPDQGAKIDDPNDPLNLQAQQVRDLAKQYGVGLADSLAAFKSKLREGTRLADLMSQSNHPNRAGHELVAAELAKWFP
jgi:lysophospholipase L1-like esterase